MTLTIQRKRFATFGGPNYLLGAGALLRQSIVRSAFFQNGCRLLKVQRNNRALAPLHNVRGNEKTGFAAMPFCDRDPLEEAARLLKTFGEQQAREIAVGKIFHFLHVGWKEEADHWSKVVAEVDKSARGPEKP